MAGVVFETFVVSQVYKKILSRGLEPALYFWRTSSGSEVDILIEEQGVLYPIEVKTTATPRPAMGSEISNLQKDLGSRTGKGYVIHLGDTTLPLAPNIEALPLIRL